MIKDLIKYIDKFKRYSKKYGALSVFILRINPLTTSDLVSYLAGFTHMKRSGFLVATALGLIPLVFFQTYGGEIIINNSPLFLGLTIFFSILYMVVFLYLLLSSFIKKNF